MLDNLRFDRDGLIPVIVQDHQPHDVLLLAYMNAEALQCTLDTRLAQLAFRPHLLADESEQLLFEKHVVGAAAWHFLMYSGYVTMAYFWAMQAAVASKKLAEGGAESKEFYKAKLYTARFYFDHLLPRAEGHASSITKPSKSLMKMPVESFVFE